MTDASPSVIALSIHLYENVKAGSVRLSINFFRTVRNSWTFNIVVRKYAIDYIPQVSLAKGEHAVSLVLILSRSDASLFILALASSLCWLSLMVSGWQGLYSAVMGVVDIVHSGLCSSVIPLPHGRPADIFNDRINVCSMTRSELKLPAQYWLLRQIT